MSKQALEFAPALPPGCVDFNKLNDAAARGDEKALEKALIVPEGETEEAALSKLPKDEAVEAKAAADAIAAADAPAPVPAAEPARAGAAKSE